jgi:hypothetical protein
MHSGIHTMAKRKDILNAALKALLAGAQASAWVKIPAAFISELASLPDDKQKVLAELSQEQFNQLLTQSELAAINAAESAAGAKQIKALIEKLIEKVDGLLPQPKPAPQGPIKVTDLGGIQAGSIQNNQQFDVFLSHNSKDESIAIQLAEKLEEYGLRVWLDVWELLPGQSWQEVLEEIIKSAKSAAILVGKDGMGPWEILEMRACLNEFVKRKRPTIPVLLPGAPKQPDLPPFLNLFQWVNLSDGLTKDGLEQLVWGITGKRPEQKADAEKTIDIFIGVKEQLSQIKILRCNGLIDDKIARKYQSKLLDRLIMKDKQK